MSESSVESGTPLALVDGARSLRGSSITAAMLGKKEDGAPHASVAKEEGGASSEAKTAFLLRPVGGGTLVVEEGYLPLKLYMWWWVPPPACLLPVPWKGLKRELSLPFPSSRYRLTRWFSPFPGNFPVRN